MSWLIHRWLLASCILILVFKDSESLFLRHTKTGKCIAAGRLFLDNQYAERYWAEMVDNCLDVSAQFRYYNELLKNSETGGTFASSGSSIYQFRFVVYKGKPILGTFENSTENYLRQTPAGSLYQYNERKCAEPSKSTRYVDEISGGCSDSAQQRFTFGSVTKFNAKMENVRCSSIQRMLIQKANYGDFNKGGTFDFDAPIDTKCSSLTTCKVKNLCGGLTNKSCDLTVSADLLSPYCTDNSKELYTEFTCVDTYSFTITEAPKVKLSESPNNGTIDIKDGLIWRKVDDENWDKDRQEMLCQHLGFEKTNENTLRTKTYGSGRSIATGDLVCYDTQSSGTSCCAHLEPSKTSGTIQIPYVTCKICDNPLDLPNKQKFPDAVFSGSGGYTQYHLARFNSAGWCSSTPETSYLLVDLQREYYITRIVIMGDKFLQTKWSGSYSMKYSHDKTLVDQSSKIKITGNQNGFKASSTSLTNIFNVRYVKIQSTGTTEFCLRIEFCGNVQMPAAVFGIIIAPSNFSARVSWRLKSAKFSSYITEFDIYLNNNYLKKINRIPGNPQNIQYLEIDGLQQNTDYTVGILPRDGFSQTGGIIYKDFTTTEAVEPPPSVKNIAAKPSNFSVHLSWTPLEPYFSSNITHFIIYLDGKERHRISRENYGNQFTIRHLKPYTEYTVGIQTQDISLQKSKIVKKIFKTKEAVPGAPPLNVVFLSRGINSLTISWKAPDKSSWNGVLTGYQLCISTTDTAAECSSLNSVTSNTFTFHGRKPSTKYFVAIAAGTSVGYGKKSFEISKITNGEPVSPVTASDYSLAVYIPKPAEYIKEIMVIVQIATSNPTPSEDIETSELILYKSSQQDIYVAAYLKTDVLPLNLVIGDGREYDSENETYFNQPLERDSNYILFLRFFESKDLYYSTEWSIGVKTMTKRPVENGDSQNSELLADDEVRMDLLIPLVIVSFCLLLVLGVFIYYYANQRRRLQDNNEQPSHKPQASREADPIQEPADSYESMEYARPGQDHSNMNVETTYETPDEVLGRNERNRTKSKQENFSGQEPSDYMSLNDNREADNVYQKLQNPTSGADQHDTKRIDHRDQTMLYNNPAFNACSNNEVQ